MVMFKPNVDQRLNLKPLSPIWLACLPLVGIIVLLWAFTATAQTPEVAAEATENMANLQVGLDTMWVLFCAFLVFFMNAGFGMVETGFCRQKNAVNILTKNLIVFALATVAYWAIGFGFMFADGTPILGTGGWFLSGADNSPATGDAYEGIFTAINWTGIPLQAKFLFQLVFAATAATIVSGAVAERIKFISFVLFSLVLTGIFYPISGHWIWGGGWLAGVTDAGFWDFAGSTVVHSVGGWAALMGALILGPRIGKYSESGPTALPGHNMGFATLGCLILWLGWFGFNPGSTMGVGDGSLIAHVATTTNVAAAFGGVAATFTAWFKLGKPDLSMVINGCLAGLVGITAPCAFVSVPSAAVIGLIAGILVVFSVLTLDNMKIDDPVGAISVHGICGVWGTLAVGLFAAGPGSGVTDSGPAAGLFLGGGFEQLIPQIIGILAVAAFTLIGTGIVWMIIKAIAGLRVPEEEEIKGLDIGEHGMEAYSGFVKEELK